MCPCASYSGKRYSRRFNRVAETAAPQNGRDKRDRWRGFPVWRAAILAVCGYCNPAVLARREDLASVRRNRATHTCSQ